MANKVKTGAHRAGISETRLQRAKKSVARSEKGGPDGQWRWYLEDSQVGQDSKVVKVSIRKASVSVKVVGAYIV